MELVNLRSRKCFDYKRPEDSYCKRHDIIFIMNNTLMDIQYCRYNIREQEELFPRVNPI